MGDGIPPAFKFMIGAASGMIAAAIAHPFDLAKNRMQFKGSDTGPKERPSMIKTFKEVIHKDGVLGLYAGVSATLLRQLVYTGTRIGMFNYLTELYTDKDGTPPGFATKTACGLVSGGIASLMATPTEVALIRMCSDGKLPPAERRNYKNVVDAFARIAREEGVLKLWSGVVPTVSRAMIGNSAQLVSYSQVKEYLILTKKYEDGLLVQFIGAMTSGLIVAIVSLPIDILKTRLQNMRYVNGKPEYTGVLHVMTTILKKEGILAFWKGMTPYYSRIGPVTLMTLLLVEKFSYLYKKHVLNSVE